MLSLPAAAWASSGPVLVGSVANSTTLSGVTAVAVSGHYAYSTAYWPGQLTVLDVSNPAAPVVVGATAPAASLENGVNVTVSGNDAFVVAKNRNASTTSNDDGSGNSLTVVDISNPAGPQVVGAVHDTSRLFGAYGVAVSGHYAFVAAQGLLPFQPAGPDTSTGSFSVVDLNNLSAGVVASIDNGSTAANLLQHATSVAISGNYAYVTAFLSGRLTVVDISNPLNPVIVGSLADWSHLAYAADVAVQGRYAYVADQTDPVTSPQFTVVDVSNPARPVVVGSLRDPSLRDAYRIRVRGSLAYVSASAANAITAVDVSNPAAPRPAGTVSGPGLNGTTGLDLDPSGRYVIASSPSAGSGTTYPPYPGQSGGPTDTGTISEIDLVPFPIAVTIQTASEPSNPTTATTAGFAFSVDDSVSTVSCRLDTGSPAPCSSPTGQQYAGLSGGAHTFTVQATDAAGGTASQSYAWSVRAAPRATSPPAITISGRQARARSGAWSGYPAPTLSYQWMRCDRHGAHCKAIRRQTRLRYTLSARDVGSRLRFAVRGRNAVGAASAVSAPSRAVSDAPTATGSFRGLATGRPRLVVTIQAAPVGPPLKQLVVALPRGLRISLAGAGATGISIQEPHRRRVVVTAVVQRGSLALTLKHSTTGLTLVIGAPALRVSAQLSAGVRRRRVRTLTLTVTALARGVRARGRVSLPAG